MLFGPQQKLFLFPNSFKLVGIIGTLARVTPGRINLAFGQVDQQRRDGLFPVERILGQIGVVAD